MSERRANYDVGSESLMCQGCGQEIGDLIEQFLVIGGLHVRSLHAVHVCGEVIHWSISDRMLADLVRRMKRDML